MQFRSPGEMRRHFSRAYHIWSFFGFARTFKYTSDPVTNMFESEEVARQFPQTLISMAGEFGSSRLTQAARENIKSIFEDESKVADTMRAQGRSDAQRLVNQAKLNNVYKNFSRRTAGLDCKLEDEEISESFKKALIALQTKGENSYNKRFDHITQLHQVGDVDSALIRESKSLISETLETLYNDIIPEKRLIGCVLDAHRARSFTKDPAQGKMMSLNVLAHTSNHLKEKIEKVDMRNHDFVSLIEMFADEEW